MTRDTPKGVTVTVSLFYSGQETTSNRISFTSIAAACAFMEGHRKHLPTWMSVTPRYTLKTWG